MTSPSAGPIVGIMTALTGQRNSRSTTVTAPRTEGGRILTRALLACGAASSAVYVAMDVATALRYDGYSFASQAVSELNAAGAPTRALFLAFSAVYNALLVACAGGIWRSAGDRRDGRLAAASLAASAMVGMATPLFAPMDQRGTDATVRGTMHGPMTLVGSIFIILTMYFGARLGPQTFRRYTFATIAVLLIFGLATALYVPRLSDGDATPGMGIVERVNIYAYLIWVATAGFVLIAREAKHAP